MTAVDAAGNTAPLRGVSETPLNRVEVGRFISPHTGEAPSRPREAISAVTDDIFDAGRFDPETSTDSPLARRESSRRPALKIVCVGATTARRGEPASVQSEPLLFLKALRSVVGTGGS